MAEFTFSQQGDVGLIEDGDEPSPDSFHHYRLRPGCFVKRNEPFGPIDFVMTPEVKLEAARGCPQRSAWTNRLRFPSPPAVDAS
jgi:hypothetical protein